MTEKIDLPPQVRKILQDLEAAGVEVEVYQEGEVPESLKQALGLGSKTSQPFSINSPEGYPPFAELLDKISGVMADISVRIVKDATESLHNHLCPKISKLEKKIAELEARIAKFETPYRTN